MELTKQARDHCSNLRKFPCKLDPGNLEFVRVPDIVRIYKVAPSLCLGFLYSTVYAEDLFLYRSCKVWVCARQKWLSQPALIEDLANQSLAISPCKECGSNMCLSQPILEELSGSWVPLLDEGSCKLVPFLLLDPTTYMFPLF